MANSGLGLRYERSACWDSDRWEVFGAMGVMWIFCSLSFFFLDWRFDWDTFLHVEKEESREAEGGGCRHTQRKANTRTERIIFDHAYLLA